jgi:hypothetical protein
MQDSTTPEANPHTISQLPHQLTARSAELAKPTPHRPTLKTSSPLFDFAEYVKLFQQRAVSAQKNRTSSRDARFTAIYVIT